MQSQIKIKLKFPDTVAPAITKCQGTEKKVFAVAGSSL